MRRFTSTSLLIIVSLSVVLFGVRAAEQPPKISKPVSALIVPEGLVLKDGVGKTEAIRITDPKKLAKLESFFPKYRQRPASDIAGGWDTGYLVYFDFPRGESVRVTVSENEDAAYWTLGRGDFKTQGDFKGFVENL